MEWRVYLLSVLACLAVTEVYVTAEPSKHDLQLEVGPNMEDELQLGGQGFPLSAYGLPESDEEDIEKRRSLMRFGKRRSLMRFGKRSSLMRFGKRPSLFRFGKRYDDETEYIPYAPYPLSEDDFSNDDFGRFPSEKRGSLLRFGKKSSLLRFGRSVDAKEPHTPWRFGRQLD